MRTRNQIVIALFLAVAAPGQTSPLAGAPLILQEAALPKYPPIAKAAHVTGKVLVRVAVRDGMVVRADVVPASNGRSRQRFLETPTVENLKTWRFVAGVNGQFPVTYTYVISGTETEKPTNDRVEMYPSLDVKVTARPVKPTVNYEKRSNPANH